MFPFSFTPLLSSDIFDLPVVQEGETWNDLLWSKCETWRGRNRKGGGGNGNTASRRDCGEAQTLKVTRRLERRISGR